MHEENSTETFIKSFTSNDTCFHLLLRLANASPLHACFSLREGVWLSKPAPPSLLIVQPEFKAIKRFNWDQFRRVLRKAGLVSCVAMGDNVRSCILIWRSLDEIMTQRCLREKPLLPLRILVPEDITTQHNKRPISTSNFLEKHENIEVNHLKSKIESILMQLEKVVEERDIFSAENTSLRVRLRAMSSSPTKMAALRALGLDDKILKQLLVLIHPDRHGGSEAAEASAKLLNELREVLRNGATNGRPA